MNCYTAKKHILERLDRVLPSEQEAALQRHVQACHACGHVARESDLTRQWLQELPDAAPSDNFEWRLKLRLAQLDRSGMRVPLFDAPRARRPWTLRFAVSAAAAALLVLSVGTLRYESLRDGTSTSAEPSTELRTSVPRLVTPTPVNDVARTPSVPRSELPQMMWPRPVPVRFDRQVGPQYPPLPAPSILGPVHAGADTAETLDPEVPRAPQR